MVEVVAGADGVVAGVAFVVGTGALVAGVAGSEAAGGVGSAAVAATGLSRMFRATASTM